MTGPFLVVCPLTVADNWINEINQFCKVLTAKAVSCFLQAELWSHILPPHLNRLFASRAVHWRQEATHGNTAADGGVRQQTN
jgi:hypothetical protein